MTSAGGINGGGVVFKINTDGSNFSKLVDFDSSSSSDTTKGNGPQGSLVLANNVLYGMTYHGGKYASGVLFKVNTDGTGFTKLLNCADLNSGSLPSGSFILSGKTLYAMTMSGGASVIGTAFKINTDGTNFFKFVDFDGTNKGKFPGGDLTQSENVFYGMTSQGGANFNSQIGSTLGVIFKYTFTLQTITFNSFTATAYGATDFSLAATTSSGLALKYSSSDETVAKIVNNNKVHIVKPGSCTIYADQAGNATYYPASASQILTIAKAPLTVTANNQTRKVHVENPPLTINYSGFVNGEDNTTLSSLPTAACSATTDSPAGDYDIIVSGGTADNYSFNYVKGTLTVTSNTAVDQHVSPDHKVYPNPVGDRLWIENGTVPVIKVEIMDVHGNIVIYQACGTSNTAVNTFGLSRGSYMVKLFYKDGSSSTTKIIKQ